MKNSITELPNPSQLASLKTLKCSPVFDELFLQSQRSVVDAIVVHKSPKGRYGYRYKRGREARLVQLQERSEANRNLQSELSRIYTVRSGLYRKRSLPELRCEPLGNYVLPIMKVQVTQKSIQELEKMDDVLAVLPNHMVRLSLPGEIRFENLSHIDLLQKTTWGLEWLGVPEIWPLTRGNHASVAVLDTGVYREHPVFNNRIKKFVMIDSHGRRVKTPTAFDTGLQGTHLGGTIAGDKVGVKVAIGVAPQCNLLVAAVLGNGSSLVTILEGIAWAIENQADVINLSFAGSLYESQFRLFLDELVDHYQVIPVIATAPASSGHPRKETLENTSSALYVDAMENFTRNDGRRRNSINIDNGHPFEDVSGLELFGPDLVAPGVQVLSAVPPHKGSSGIAQYAYLDGSSTAAAHTSGVVALLASAYPSVPMGKIVNALKLTAINSYTDAFCRYGVLNPKAAFESLR